MSAGTPIFRVSSPVVTGSVPALLCVVNAVSWAGKILRKKMVGLTSPHTRSTTALTGKASTKQAR